MRIVQLAFFLFILGLNAATYGAEIGTESTSASCSIDWFNPNCTEADMRAECTANLGERLGHCTSTQTTSCEQGVNAITGADMVGCTCSGHCLTNPVVEPF
jgi:hypothetical protein